MFLPIFFAILKLGHNTQFGHFVHIMAILNIMAWVDIAKIWPTYIYIRRVFCNYRSPVKRINQNIYLKKVMAKINFTPDIGYHKCNLLCTCNVNTTIKGHLAGSVRGGYKQLRYGLKMSLSFQFWWHTRWINNYLICFEKNIKSSRPTGQW